MSEEVVQLSGEILTLKAELYDVNKVNTANVAAMTKAYSIALLKAAEMFDLQYEGRQPVSVDEFMAALNELGERNYNLGQADQGITPTMIG